MSSVLRTPLRLPMPWRLLVIAVLAVVAGSGLWAPPPAQAAVGVPTPYQDQSFPSGVASPTQDKPQSKLWYNAGSWWALMVSSSGPVTIHELNRTTHTWRDTGTVVDSRSTSTGDALWSASSNQLWVVSRAPGSNAIVNRISYNAGNRSWTVNPGFPITLNTGGGSESATIDQASDGKYWVTYTRGSRLWVTRSTDGTGDSWVAPFQPAGIDTTLSSDDLSAVIAFGNSVGVMYSDQQSGAFRFAIHDNGDPDTTWRSENAWSGTNIADDHINLKQLTGDSQGRIFAAVKTSVNDSTTANPGDTLTAVVTRSGAGAWTVTPTSTVADDYTRPQIVIDSTNQELYFFATAPVNGGDIYYKHAPLSKLSALTGGGRGARFVDVPFTINNATTGKDPVTAATGLVVVASSTSALRYAHAEMDLPGGGSTDTTPPTVTARTPAPGATGVATTTAVSATFSEPVNGVSGTTFTLAGPSGPVAGTVARVGTTNQYTLTPGAALAAGTTYTANLTSGITDASGNALAPVNWTFTTATAGGGGGDTTAPTVTARAPAVNATAVGPSPNVTATFSEVVQGVDATTFTLRNNRTGTNVAAVVSRNGTTNQWILNPNTNFTADTSYTATLTGGANAIRDTAGNPLATVSWSFLTGPRPTVTARTPAAGATGVSRTENVTATFSEPVTGVSGTTFTLRPAAGGATITATVTQSGTTNQYVLDPGVTLAANTQYRATLTGGTTAIRDLAGNPLATATWTFTTGA